MDEQLTSLFFRYLKGTATVGEIERVSTLIARGGHDREWELAAERLANSLKDSDSREETVLSPAEVARIRKRILKSVDKHTPVFGLRSVLRSWIPYAAAIVFFIAIGLWLYRDLEAQQSLEHHEIGLVDAQPAGNRATLQLADGRVINLQSGARGIAVADGRVNYQGKQQPVVDLNEGLSRTELVLRTPKGGFYSVLLPDGSQVWLNADSRLYYPAQFDENQRLVKLEGEAYFAVSKDAGRPFKVRTRGQEITVLGTEFNVSAYQDELETRTTLVSGAVLVAPEVTQTAAKRLLPGERSVLYEGALNVEEVDVAGELGWKNGNFVFKGAELREAMKQISRWYDVEVVYEGAIPQTPFHGSFSRSLSLSQALEILEEAEVNFRLKKQGSVTTLIVQP